MIFLYDGNSWKILFELYLVAPDTLQELHKEHVNVVSKYDFMQDGSTGRQEEYSTEYKISL